VVDPRRGLSVFFLKFPWNEFATKSGHAEIATSLGVSGTSGGGIWANDMAFSTRPSARSFLVRALGDVCSRPEFIQLKFRLQSMRFHVCFRRRRKRKPSWAAPLPLQDTSQALPLGSLPIRVQTLLWGCRYLAIPFFYACLQMRLTNEQNLKAVD